MPRYLTKSRFLMATECSVKLFYTGKREYPNTLDTNEFMAALAEGGYQVGYLARHLFDEAVTVDTLDADAAVAQTDELLGHDGAVICEAAIRHGDFFVRVDILKRKGKTIELYEVKSKKGPDGGTFQNDKGFVLPDWLPYLNDIAFQTMVASLAFPDQRIKPHLVLLDGDAACPVDGLNQMFPVRRTANGRIEVRVTGDPAAIKAGTAVLKVHDVGRLVRMIHDGEESESVDADRLSFQERALAWAALYRDDRKAPVEIGLHCKGCEYRVSPADLEPGQRSGYEECWTQALGWTREQFDKPHIFDIWNFRKCRRLLADGIYLMEDLDPDVEFENPDDDPQAPLTTKARHYLQVTKAVGGDNEEYIGPGLANEIAEWRFPLHFIDFETTMAALPLHRGRRPYETIAFQFSCHTLRKNRAIEHREWISAEPGRFPNVAFVRALKAVLEHDDGTVFRYAAHENTVLRHIHGQLVEILRDGLTSPDYSDLDDLPDLMTFIDTLTHWDDYHEETGAKATCTGLRCMVDMCDLVKKYQYHPLTGGSNSLKYVLPAILSTDRALQKRHFRPAGFGTNNAGVIWYQPDPVTGLATDPYSLLPPLLDGVDLPADDLLLPDGRIAEGGAAMVAWARMQFSEMSEAERAAIVRGLLRYCELDTLAMVMLYQHWVGGDG